MKYIKQGVAAGMYAINSSNQEVQVYYDLWQKVDVLSKEHKYKVRLAPAYFVKGIKKFQYYKGKLYFRVQYYNEKLDALPYWQEPQKKSEEEAKKIIAAQHNTVAFFAPMVERGGVLGVCTGNKIVSNNQEFVEIKYVPRGDYEYYFKKDLVTYMQFSTQDIDKLNVVPDAHLLYRGFYYMPRNKEAGKNEGRVQLGFGGTEYFGFTRKANEKWRVRWICLEPPKRVWLPLKDITLSVNDEGKIDNGGKPPVSNDNNNNNQGDNEEATQEAGFKKFLPYLVIGGLAYAVFKD